MGRTAQETTPKTRARMPIPKAIQDISKKVADEAIANYAEQRQAIDEETLIPGNSSSLDEENFVPPTTEEMIGEVEDRERQDVFDRGDAFAKTGVLLSYTISKNNAFWGMKKHPYSWAILQQEGGAGFYRIRATNPQTGKYAGGGSQEIAEPAINKTAIQEESQKATSTMEMLIMQSRIESEKREQRILEESRRREEQQQRELAAMKEESKQNANSFQQLMVTFLSGNQNKGDSEELKLMREEMRLQQQKSNEVLMTMVMGSHKGDDTTKLMMEMQKMNMEMQKESRREMLELLKETKEETAKLIEKLADNKKDEFGALELMKMQEDARRAAKDEMRTFYELVDEKADEKAQRLSGNDGEEVEESTTSSLIKALGPLVGSMMQNGMANRAPAQLEAPQAPITHVTPPPRRAPRPVQVGTPVDSNGQRTQPVQSEGSTNRQAPRQSRPASSVGGLPSVSNVVDPAKEEGIKRIKEQLLAMITPLVLESMVSREEPRICATKTINALNDRKINPMIVKEIFVAQEIIDYAAMNGIGDEQYPGVSEWLGSYFDAIIQQT